MHRPTQGANTTTHSAMRNWCAVLSRGAFPERDSRACTHNALQTAPRSSPPPVDRNLHTVSPFLNPRSTTRFPWHQDSRNCVERSTGHNQRARHKASRLGANAKRLCSGTTLHTVASHAAPSPSSPTHPRKTTNQPPSTKTNPPTRSMLIKIRFPLEPYEKIYPQALKNMTDD